MLANTVMCNASAVDDNSPMLLFKLLAIIFPIFIIHHDTLHSSLGSLHANEVSTGSYTQRNGVSSPQLGRHDGKRCKMDLCMGCSSSGMRRGR